MLLSVENFGALGPGSSTFNFDDGITAIVGPNGTGKSTLVEALYFAITGDTLRDGRIEDLITWGCNSMEVFLQLDDIVISRSISKDQPSKVEFVRGKTKLTRKTEVDEAVLAAFGLSDKSVFRQVYFSEQFKAVDILDGPDSGRLAMLTNLFGFGKFEKIRKALQDSMNGLYTNLVDDTLKETLENNVNNCIINQKEIIDRINANAKSILSQSDLDNVNKVCSMKSKEEYDALKNSLEDAKKSVEGLERSLSELPPAPDKSEADKYGKAFRLRELTKELEVAEKAFNEEGGSVQPSCEKISELRRKASVDQTKALQEIEQLQQRLTLVQGGKCPLTQGSICADLRAMTDPSSINLQIANLQSEIATINQDIASLDSMFVDSQKRERRATEVRANYNKLREMIQPLQAYADFDIEAYEEKVNKNKEADRQRTLLCEQLGSAKQEVLRKTTELQDAETVGVLNEELIEQAKESKKKHDEALIVAQELSTQLDQADKLLAQAKQAKSDAEAQNIRAHKGLYAKDILNKTRTILHKDKLPRQLIDALKAELNSKQAQYLSWFGFKYRVEWQSGGSLVYYNSLGEAVPVTNLSGGQKYVVLTAFRCALVEFLHSSFPFMVLDEPTTGLDVENREALATVLYRVSETMTKHGLHLIIPTHDSALLTNADVINIGG